MKFEIGDKVRLVDHREIREVTESLPLDSRGIVVENTNSSGWVGVEWENFNDGWDVPGVTDTDAGFRVPTENIVRIQLEIDEDGNLF